MGSDRHGTGGADKRGVAKPDLTPQESVSGQLKVISSLSPADTGKFLDWNGEVVPF